MTMKRITAVILIILAAAAPLLAGGNKEGGGSDTLRLSMGGSTTMEPIMSSALEYYRTEVDPTAELSYDAQGSTAGIQGVLNGIYDLGGASRALLPSEKQQGVKTTTVALDGIAVIVHDTVPIDNITVEDLAAIFVGEIRNWKQLDGPDEQITVVNRDAASGTFGAFREIVLVETYGDDARFIRNALVTESNGNMATMVTQTPYAIGYASLNTIPRVRESGGKVLTVNGIADTRETVMTGKYPITRPLNLVHYGEPTKRAQVFIDFLLSPEGQQIIREERFLPIGAAQ